ncbi:substrate-binding domain-containing protein [Streptomyces chartreusis]|uniref:substrate-binding domain-containing protein n=1 Tax=Streptomyces chartreusis TaxID=1969 RepID=UPI003D91C884
MRSRAYRALTLVAAGTLVAACTSVGSSKASPVQVGLVYSRSGLLAAYGKQYEVGFRAGLDYATHGTNEIEGHPIQVTEHDDAGDPATAVAATRTLIGKGFKIIAGTTDSGVALQMAPLAAQNKVLYISGPAATDAVTSGNPYTFRSGRQVYQDVRAAETLLGDVASKKITVLAQDSVFGRANLAAVRAILGDKGAHVVSVLAPLSVADLTPFARQTKATRPDVVFVAWSGTTTAGLWTALKQQGVPRASKVVTALSGTASYPIFAPADANVVFFAHYFPGATGDNAVERAMLDGITNAGGTPDLFSVDGFTAAQMIVHAVSSGSSTDTAAMAKALEGWTFNGPKGREHIRARDHALLQPMFTARLRGRGSAAKPELVSSIPMMAVAPPENMPEG